MILLALLGTLQDPPRAYLDGLAALERGRPEVAAERFREALDRLGEETPSLYYRDGPSRACVAYHPHYLRARALLAQDADRVAEAVAHLERSIHPAAEPLLRDIRSPSEGPVAAARRRWVEELCREERFEQALRAAEDDPRLADRVRVRRGRRLDAHERALAEALERLDLLARPEQAAALFRQARVPPRVQAHPEPRLRWAARFAEFLEREAPRLREAARLPLREALATADALEQAAEGAARAGCGEGALAAFRAAQALRLARLEAPATTRAEARALLEAAQAAIRRGLSLGLPEREARGFAARLAAHPMPEAPALEDPGRMADPAALAAAAVRVEPAGPLPPSARARVLLERALLEASRLFLEGESDAAVAERCGPAIAEALALDPSAAKAFDGLSPRLRALRTTAK